MTRHDHQGDRSVVLRPLTAADLDAVARIEAASAPTPWSRQLFAGELTVSPRLRHWLVAEVDAQVVAFAGVMILDDEAHLMNIAVAPSHRRFGLGGQLLIALIDEVVDRGVRHLTLEVRVDNTAALALYRRFSLAPVGTRKDYYGPGEDALILWAHDIDEPEYLASLNGATPEP